MAETTPTVLQMVVEMAWSGAAPQQTTMENSALGSVQWLVSNYVCVMEREEKEVDRVGPEMVVLFEVVWYWKQI